MATSIFIHKGKHYHLLEQFILRNEEGESNEPTAILCYDCYSDVGKGIRGKKVEPRRPKYSIANGVDFGQAKKLDLPSLSLAEQIVLAPAQEMGNIIKLKGFQNPECQSALLGNIITYKKPNDIILRELDSIRCEQQIFPRPQSIDATLSVVFIGAKMGHASLIPTASHISTIQVNPDKIYKWCAAKKKIDPLWENVVIDETPEMVERLKRIPQSLIDSAKFIDDDKCIAIEDLIEKMAKQEPTHNENNMKHQSTHSDVNSYKEEHSVFLTHPYPPPDEQHAAEKILLKSTFSCLKIP